MWWLTDNFLFDVTVVVATLQSATSRTKSNWLMTWTMKNQFFLGSIWTKERKEEHNNKSFHTDHLITTKSVFFTEQSISSPVL